jgi:hypothetical protein
LCGNEALLPLGICGRAVAPLRFRFGSGVLLVARHNGVHAKLQELQGRSDRTTHANYCKAALQGLKFLQQCGVIHNGTNGTNTSNITDLHLRNLLFKFGPSDVTLEEVLGKDKNYGEPANFGIYTLDDCRQVKYFQSQPLSGFGAGDQIHLDDMIIKIGDFGHGT